MCRSKHAYNLWLPRRSLAAPSSHDVWSRRRSCSRAVRIVAEAIRNLREHSGAGRSHSLRRGPQRFVAYAASRWPRIPNSAAALSTWSALGPLPLPRFSPALRLPPAHSAVAALQKSAGVPRILVSGDRTAAESTHPLEPRRRPRR